MHLVAIKAQENTAFTPLLFSTTYVSCSQLQNPTRKTFQEYIDQGLCLQQCRNNKAKIEVSAYPTSTVWTIVGGVIQTQTPNYCIVNWGTGTDPSITVSSVVGGVTINFPTLCVELNNSPESSFTVAPAIRPLDVRLYKACINQVINFTDLSSAAAGTPINNRWWDFGDGTQSNEINPSHAYTAPGTYTVRNYLSNSCNCLVESTLTVEVKNKSVDIVCPSVVCEGEKTTYSIEDPFNITNCSSFDWSVVGGTIVSAEGPRIEVVWNPTTNTSMSYDGFGYVSFNPSVCDIGCYSPTTVKVPIIKSSNQAIFWEGAAPNSTVNTNSTAIVALCGTTQQKFEMPQWPSTDFVWEIINAAGTPATNAIVYTDQRNEILLNPESLTGTFTLRCRYFNTLLKCGGVATRTINVSPEVIIDGSSTACLLQPETYTSSTGTIVTWKYRLLPNGALTGTFVGDTFTPVFPTAGQYEIVVVGSIACGNSTKLVTVVGVPVLTASQVVGSTLVCNGTPSTFTVANAVPNTVIGWQVTNGVISGSNYASAITVNFNTVMPEVYSLTVWRESTLAPYCRSASVIIPLTPTVISNIITGPVSPCGSTTATYSNATTGADNLEWTVVPASAGNIVGANNGNSVQVLWNQGVPGPNPFVRLKINKCNKTSIGSLEVAVSNPQLALTTPLLTFCSGLSQPFTAASAIAPLTSGAVTWNFGDGSTETSPNNVFTVYHVFNNTNTSNASYTVTATIVNPNGCIVTITKAIMVTVKPAPIADITPVVSRCAVSINLIPLADRLLTVNIQNSNGVSIRWFKDGIVVPAATATTYTPATFGLYHAEVNNGNCTNITNKVNFFYCELPQNPCAIIPAPNLNATILNNCGVITANASFTGTATSLQWIAPATGTILSATNTMSQTVTEPGSYLYLFKATFMGTNGQPCANAITSSVIVPYLADLKTDISCPTTATGQYNVTLSDFSKVFATTPITSWQFSVNNVLRPKNLALNDLDTNRHITLAPGTYTLKLVVGRAGYASCTKTITLVLPSFPTAIITAGGGITCENSSMLFTTPTQTGCSYKWSFNLPLQQAATNLQQNPRLTFAAAQLELRVYEVKLTVTNRVGCSATSASKFVTVNPFDLRGKLPDNNITLCQGETASVLYENTTGAQAVTSYQWMNNNVPVAASAGGNANPLITATSGTYWVRIGNTFGCKEEIFGPKKCTVTFVTQNVSITGGLTFCLNKPVELSAAVAGSTTASGSTAQYEWTRDDLGSTVISATAMLSDVPASVGSYTYRLVVYTPKGTGGFCTSTATKTITVVQEPTITSLFFDTPTCNPYSFTLHATANMSGTFAWSNGTTGADITTNFGGVYKVLFTSNSGCTATAQIETPRSPDSYLWEFPSGCYKYCNKLDFSRSFLGPALAVFPTGWTWGANTLVAAVPAASVSGVAAMPPYSISDDSGIYKYSMVLNASAQCNYTSKPATIRFDDCAPCNLHSFVASATNPLLVQSTVNTPYLYYRLKFNFTPGAKVINLINMNNDGIFIPSTVNVPDAGLTNVMVQFVPNTFPYFGPINMAFSTRSSGESCESFEDILIAGGPVVRTLNEQVTASLNLSPNPANSSVHIAYEFAPSDAVKTIAIYDITGRLLQQKTATVAKDVWEVALDGLLAGPYIVVMKENDQVAVQKNLMKAD